MNYLGEWTIDEIETAFNAYVWMYEESAANRPIVKAELIRGLQAGALSHRSKSSIERRFQNFSWIFQEHGISYVPGYVPLPHVGRVVKTRVLELMQRAGLLQVSS
jgi:5-methylcytosine-specific restriction enzyme A